MSGTYGVGGANQSPYPSQPTNPAFVQAGDPSTLGEGAPDGVDPSKSTNSTIDPALLELLGLELDSTGMPVYKGTSGTSGTSGVGAVQLGAAKPGAGSTTTQTVLGGVQTLGEVSPPRVNLTSDAAQGAESVSTQVSQVLDEVMIKGYNKDGTPMYKDPSEISSEDLLTAFLKLNITDPNNSVDVLNKLSELAKDLRDASIKLERSRLQEQEANLEEAQKKAKDHGSSKIVKVISTVVMAVVAVVAAFIRGGPYAAIAAAAVIVASFLITLIATGSLDKAMTAAQIASMIVIAVCMMCPQTWVAGVFGAGCGTTLGVAGAAVAGTAALALGSTTVARAYENKRYADALAAADSAGARAKRAQLKADEAEGDFKDLQEIIKAIMEGKGAVIDAVLKMSANTAATNMKLLSLAASR